MFQWSAALSVGLTTAQGTRRFEGVRVGRSPIATRRRATGYRFRVCRSVVCRRTRRDRGRPRSGSWFGWVRNRVMSSQVSAMMTWAVIFLTKGMVSRCSIWRAKGRIPWSIRDESSSMVTDSSSMRVGCMRHKKLWCSPKLPVRAWTFQPPDLLSPQADRHRALHLHGHTHISRPTLAPRDHPHEPSTSCITGLAKLVGLGDVHDHRPKLSISFAPKLSSRIGVHDLLIVRLECRHRRRRKTPE